MKKVAVQEFLRNGGTLEELQEKFKILVKRHGEFPNLVLLKYHSIESPMEEEIVQDCRGIILDESDNWKIVCFPYRKFFNFGEPLAAKIDIRTATVYEKLDGSLMTLYFYKGDWRVASSGTPDANGNVNGANHTFADLFWRVWKQLEYNLSDLDSSYCYMFELMTNENRIVVYHPKDRLVLHGVRCIDERRSNYLEELDPGLLTTHIEKVDWYLWLVDEGLQEIIESCKDMDPVKEEGYVVCDKNFNRVKVKSPNYVALHHCKNNLNSFKNLVNLVLNNEGLEFLAYFPEMQEQVEKIQKSVDRVEREIEKHWDYHKKIENQKEFALAIKDFQYKDCLFRLRSGRVASGGVWLRELLGDKASDLIKGAMTC